jgi:AAA15 family ATPase/GTPase
MLKQLRIKNFKRLTELVELCDLANVNYLVGDNGCGKNSILSAIRFYNIYGANGGNILTQDAFLAVNPLADFHELFRSRGFIETKYFSGYLDSCQIYFDGHHKIILPLEFDQFESRLKTTKQANLSHLTHFLKQETPFQPNLEVKKYFKHLSKNFENKNFSKGEQVGSKILNSLAESILYLKIKYDINLFLLEEPENHLHPSWQKQIPQLLEFLSIKFKLQFIVATHSPFILASSGQLFTSNQNIFRSDSRLDRADINQKTYQKVYLMKDGQIASKRSLVEMDSQGKNKGRFGYWGQKSGFISARILGTGLKDFISPVKTVFSADSPRLVLCEGEGSDSDFRIYNTIFADLEPRVLFVSTRGSSQVYQAFQILTEVKHGISANFELLMVRDRDHEFKSEQEILRYESLNFGLKVLRRRAIEAYLFDPEIIEKLFKKYKLRLTQNAKQSLTQLQLEIQAEAEAGETGSSYKFRFKQVFETICNQDLYRKISEFDLNIVLAELVTSETLVYKELHQLIFGNILK